MKSQYKLIQALTLAFFFMGSSVALAEFPAAFTALDQQNTSGQIHGKVASCSPKYNPAGTLVHIPGMSVSTKLSSSGEFNLIYVPSGQYELVFEQDGRVFHSLNKITVNPNHRTELGHIQVCPDMDGDGYNVLADVDDNNPAFHPDAVEICDRKDNNGNGVVDEGCSYRKCPKGGNFCLNNWNNSNPDYRDAQDDKKSENTAETEDKSFFSFFRFFNNRS